MRRVPFWVGLALLCCLVLGERAALAQTTTCDALRGARLELARSLLASEHPYDCCDDTILACLRQKQVCRLATRLANDICRRVGSGQDRAAIERALVKRAQSMVPLGRPVVVELAHSTPAGEDGARVTAVIYLCGRCPFCAKLTPALYQAVAEGPLKGKVRLFAKVFPIRSHEHSTEAGLALLAAEKLGSFWPFLSRMYAGFDRFELSRLPEWAEGAGMHRDEFSSWAGDPRTRALLVEDKKEGTRNKVEATPTIFIQGRRYVADLELGALVDALEEEHDRVTGKLRE